MVRGALITILASLALAGCNRAMVPAGATTAEQQPALAAPPPSMMTPNGY